MKLQKIDASEKIITAYKSQQCSIIRRVPSAQKTRYESIGIMTDADTDGQPQGYLSLNHIKEISGRGSIYPLLLAFLSHWPELFQHGKVKFVKTPMVIITNIKTGEQHWYYSQAEYDADKDKYPSSKFDYRYIKGLGSLEVDEYKRVINEPHYEVVSLPDNYKELFEMLFGNDTDKRKDWMLT